jgi:hypothetical protein
MINKARLESGFLSAPLAGLEPATHGLEDRYSIR